MVRGKVRSWPGEAPAIQAVTENRGPTGGGSDPGCSASPLALVAPAPGQTMDQARTGLGTNKGSRRYLILAVASTESVSTEATTVAIEETEE